MRHSSMVTITASVLALVAGCSNDDNEQVVTTPAGTSFVVPVTDFDLYPDTAMWDNGFYDPVLVASLVGQVVSGDGGSILTDAGIVVPTRAFPRPLGSLLASWGAVVNSACTPLVPTVDNDQDGIPATYSATFNCSGITSGNKTTTVTGGVTVTDANDNSPTGGLTMTFSNFLVAVATSSTNARSRTLNGTVSLLPVAGGSFQATHSVTTTFSLINSDTDQVQGTFASNEQATYTPDSGATDPFSSGSVNLTGGGTLTRGFNGANLTRQVTRVTSPALHWNRSCRTNTPTAFGYDAGKLTYTDDSGSSLSLTFSGCGAPTVSTN